MKTIKFAKDYSKLEKSSFTTTILDHFIQLAKIKPTLLLYIVNDQHNIGHEINEVVNMLKYHFRFISAHGRHQNIVNIPFISQPEEQQQSQIKFFSWSRWVGGLA
ncbi:hypothetical protein DSECCO2_473190 [anaerobic digester metagenome]